MTYVLTRVAAIALPLLYVATASAMPDFMRTGQNAASKAGVNASTDVFAAEPAAAPALTTTTLTLKKPARPAATTEPVAAPIRHTQRPQVTMPAVAPIATTQSGSAPVYTLGTGDEIRMTIFGEEELSGEFEIDGSGAVSLPLIGQQRASGLSVPALEQQIAAAYANGYLIAPRVSVEVLNFRPFYIVGEVNNPGNYPYMNGLTVLNAVAVAGGYTPRARKKNIEIKRIVNGQEQYQEVGEAALVQPGDMIEVKERFF